MLCSFVSLSGLHFGDHVIQCLRGNVLAGLVVFHLWVFPGASTCRSPWQLRAVDAFWVESLGVPGCPGNHGFWQSCVVAPRSLLVDAQSMVPAEEVARLRYADLPSSPGIFPSPLLDSALTKMCAASNDALVQRTLHPPNIPRKSSAGSYKADFSSSASANHSGVLPVGSWSQQ